ncbi:hypothetical protein HYV11_02785 [Candidatus Dependentiae bacterium]|nr:hypothetical protein [Candidatus Dependentiae bacterium]
MSYKNNLFLTILCFTCTSMVFSKNIKQLKRDFIYNLHTGSAHSFHNALEDLKPKMSSKEFAKFLKDDHILEKAVLQEESNFQEQKPSSLEKARKINLLIQEHKAHDIEATLDLKATLDLCDMILFQDLSSASKEEAKILLDLYNQHFPLIQNNSDYYPNHPYKQNHDFSIEKLEKIVYKEALEKEEAQRKNMLLCQLLNKLCWD